MERYKQINIKKCLLTENFKTSNFIQNVHFYHIYFQKNYDISLFWFCLAFQLRKNQEF